MQTAIDSFRVAIGRVRHLGGVHSAISKITTDALEASDILRAQIVLVVAALDYYVHEATVLGMIEVFEGKRAAPESYAKFKVPISSVPGILNAPSGWFASEVRLRHSFLSFQQPDKIADAIRMFSQVNLWAAIANRLHLDESLLKMQLKLIVDRRNKIAHEADIDPSYPGMRWPISGYDVDSSVDFIERLVEAMHEVVA